MARFRRGIESKYRQSFDSYSDFHSWSVENPETFWSELIDFGGLITAGSKRPAVMDLSFERYAWFPGLKMNFAENLLAPRPDDQQALLFVHESGLERTLSYGELKREVRALQLFLRDYIKAGDCVAAYMPNTPETVVTMLATTALGGVFTSTSADFGFEGVMDRFGQSRPKVLLAATHYTYNGKRFDNREKIARLTQELDSLEAVILVDFLAGKPDLRGIRGAFDYQKLLTLDDHKEIVYTPRALHDPGFIMYSSGTTGKPKCIVHSAGGVLLQHYKELALHTNLKANQSLLYFTTCGWMMWNWLVSALMLKSRVVLYEGSPGAQGLKNFLALVERHQIEVLGLSPKFLKALEDEGGPYPALNALQTLLSTGAPLLPEQFDFVYRELKDDLQLSSISGGTDILGCFMLGNPELPVYRGEIQCLGLGMDVKAYSEKGEPLIDQEGELVCQKSFPSRPLSFLNDEQGAKLKEAYFSQFANVWTHGDFVTITKRGGVQVFGRSDATLNPGGVRIGTAEIYRQTEQLPFIEDSLCVGRPVEGDVRVVLFVKLKAGESLSEERVQLIKKTIRDHTTPRHVPGEVHVVDAIPYTRSGKKMELVISRLMQGKAPTNLEAMANPEALDQYAKFC